MSHSHSYPHTEEKLSLGAMAKTLTLVCLAVGVIGLVVTFFGSSGLGGTGGGIRRFWFAYLLGYVYFLSLALGGLYFVLVQYCVRAGWSIAVRRVPEAMARTLPLFLVLAIPLVWSILKNDGALYRWAQPTEATHEEMHASVERGTVGEVPTAHDAGTEKRQEPNTSEVTQGHGGGEHGEGMSEKKEIAEDDLGIAPGAYPIPDPQPITEDGKPIPPDHHLVGPKKESFLLLNPIGVITITLASLVILSGIAYWYTGYSRKQDDSGDPELTRVLNIRAAPMLVIYGVTLTALVFALVMSLDPKWFSTMFGPYYFAGCAVSVHAFTIIVLKFLQGKGYLKNSVGRDHYHDLGKWTFAFTFFYGYVAFSQYMLLWYSSQPEEIEWLARRGASTAAAHLDKYGAFTIVVLLILFGKILIPFAGLLSRHVKRHSFGLIFWAVWVLAFHLVDMYWCIMPELDGGFHFGIPEIAGVLGVGGLFFGVFIWALSGAALRPMRDPRTAESLGFHQSF